MCYGSFRAQIAYLKGANISPETLPQTVIPHMLSTPWVGMAVITHLLSSSWVSRHPSTQQNSLGLRPRFIQSFLICCYPLPPPGLKLELDLWSGCQFQVRGDRWRQSDMKKPLYFLRKHQLSNKHYGHGGSSSTFPTLKRGSLSSREGREGIVITLNATSLPIPSQVST